MAVFFVHIHNRINNLVFRWESPDYISGLDKVDSLGNSKKDKIRKTEYNKDYTQMTCCSEQVM